MNLNATNVKMVFFGRYNIILAFNMLAAQIHVPFLIKTLINFKFNNANTTL